MNKVRSKDGTPIAYEQSGTGPPLMLVHGALASHARWNAILPSLTPHHTVYAIDRRGRGESGDADHYDLAREFEDVAAVADAIDEPVNILGHSFGALCALEATLLSENIRSVIAYEPPPAPVPDGAIEKIQEFIDSGDGEGAITYFLSELVKMPPHELERFKATPIFQTRVAAAHTIPRELLAAMNHVREPEKFKDMNVPTLMLLGGDSPAFARENVENWHNTLPNSRIVVLPGQQHIAMDTAPDLFVREILAFLAEQN